MKKYYVRFFVNVFFAGVGAVCCVTSIRDAIRDSEMVNEERRLRHAAWETVTRNGTGETSR